MEHLPLHLDVRRIGTAPFIPLFGLLFALALPARGLAALPPGVSAADWVRGAPKTPEEANSLIDRLQRASRLAHPAAAVRAEGASPATGPAEGVWEEWGPPSRELHTLVYDSRRDRTIAFGGNALSRDNLWVLSLAGAPRWMPLAAGGSAPATGPSGAVYDSAADRLLVLAPSATPGGGEELWALPLGGATNWTRLATTGTAPASDPGAGLVLDESGRRLFALASTGASGEVWKLDLATSAWSNVIASGPAGGIGHDGSAFYDRARDRLVALSTTDLWALNLGAPPLWSRLAEFFPESTHDRLILDRAGDAAIVLEPSGAAFSYPLAGGSMRTLVSACGCGTDRTGFAAAYDSRRRRVVEHGGWDSRVWNTQSSTLALDLVATPGWSEIGPSSGGARHWQTAVADPASGNLVVYGGSYSACLDPGKAVLARPLADLFASTTSLTPSGATRPRFYYGHSMTNDASRGRILFYGGQAADGTGDFLDGLWSLSGGDAPVWSQLSPSGSGPGRRVWHAAWLDPTRDRLIVLGGSSPQPGSANAWELTFAPTLTWRPLTVAGDHDGSRITHAFLNVTTGEAWAWGSSAEDLYRIVLGADTLKLETVPQTGVPAEWWHLDPLLYDASRRRLVVFEADPSGRDVTSGFWSVDLGASATWTWKSTGMTRPRDRSTFSAVHDPSRDRVIIYGGYDDNTHYFDDWWSLKWDRPTLVAVSLAGARVENGVAHLVWQFDDAVGTSVEIERSRAGAEWTARGSLLPDALGRVSFDDDRIEPATRYGYRLILRETAGVRILGETWLDVPAVPVFALRGALANPVAGDLVVSFSLARASEATLGLFDLGGRRLTEQRIHAEAAGPREVTLARRGEFPPGIYFLRLADGAQATTARVVLAN